MGVYKVCKSKSRRCSTRTFSYQTICLCCYFCPSTSPPSIIRNSSNPHQNITELLSFPSIKSTPQHPFIHPILKLEHHESQTCLRRSHSHLPSMDSIFATVRFPTTPKHSDISPTRSGLSFKTEDPSRVSLLLMRVSESREIITVMSDRV
jgi:hypothetical protein